MLGSWLVPALVFVGWLKEYFLARALPLLALELLVIFIHLTAKTINLMDMQDQYQALANHAAHN